MPREIIKTGGPGKTMADIRRTLIVGGIFLGVIVAMIWLFIVGAHSPIHVNLH